MKGAELVVKSIKDCGIDTIFSYPGGPVLSIYPYLEEYGIAVVQCRHEQDGFHMAQGYARESGKFGVLLVTSGPGITNSVTGMADAFADSCPVLLIAGQVSSDGFDDFQASFNIAFVQTVCGAIEEPKLRERLPEAIGHCLNALLNDSKPALLSLHSDILLQDGDQELTTVAPKISQPLDLEDAARILDAILTHKRVFFLLGGGVRQAMACELADHIMKQFGFNFGFSLRGVGSVEDCGKNAFGLVGSYGNFHANHAISQADLVIVVGAHLSTRTTCKPDRFAKNSTLIHIDIDRCAINRRIEADLGVIADAKDFFEYLSQSLDLIAAEYIEQLKGKNLDFTEEVRSLVSPTYPDLIEERLHPEYAIKTILNYIPRNAPLTCDVGQHQMWVAKNYKGTSLNLSANHGTMGFALPNAIGRALATRSKTQVYSIMGDGGFQMAIPQLAVIKDEGLQVILIIINNHSLGMIRQTQRYALGVEGTFGFKFLPSLRSLAEAYELPYISISSKQELQELAENMSQLSASTIIEVCVDQQVDCLPRVPSGKSLTRMLK